MILKFIKWFSMTGNYSIPICFLVSNTEKLASEMEKHILTCCYVHEIHLGAFLDRALIPNPTILTQEVYCGTREFAFS